MKQMAYARRILGAKGLTKKEIALDVGYSPSVSKSIGIIERTRGFNNAMSRLATDSNNLALAAMHEFKARGFEDFTNKELVGALNAVASAWSRFNVIPKEKQPSEASNKLRTIVLQRIENQTNVSGNSTLVTPSLEASDDESIPSGDGIVDVEDPMDF